MENNFKFKLILPDIVDMTNTRIEVSESTKRLARELFWSHVKDNMTVGSQLNNKDYS